MFKQSWRKIFVSRIAQPKKLDLGFHDHFLRLTSIMQITDKNTSYFGHGIHLDFATQAHGEH
jgi:hypothetical protein